MSEKKRKYTQEAVEEAVNLVRTGQMSLNGASKLYNIPFSTLGDKVRGRRPIQMKSKFLLTEEEELKLVQWIKLHSERSMGRTYSDVRDKAAEIMKLRNAKTRRADGKPCRDWMTSFVKRHKLSLRSPQSLGKERALVSPDSMLKWFTDMKHYLNEQDPTLLKCADRIFNADETGFSLAPAAKRVLAPLGKKFVYEITNNTKHILTVVACCSAAGEYSPPLIVYPRKRMPTENLLEGFDEAFMQISHNGWTNAQIFKTWIIDIFVPFVQDKMKPVVLFLDGHCSHNSDMEMLELCNQHGIILYGLLPHASHIIQPLDLSIFGTMKAEWANAVKRNLELTGETASVKNFAKLLKYLWTSCANPEACLKGFMKSGIFPFNPNMALSSGKMEAFKSFASPAAVSSTSSAPPSTSSACGASPSISSSCSATPSTLACIAQSACDASTSTSSSCGATQSTSSACNAQPNTPSACGAPSTLSTKGAHLPTMAPPDVTRSVHDKTFQNLDSLFKLSFKLGQEKTLKFLQSLQQNDDEGDDEYKNFCDRVLALEVIPPNISRPGPSQMATSKNTLDDLFSLPQLPKNKSGKVQKKNSSLCMAFTSEKYIQMKKQKDDEEKRKKEEKEMKKREREKLREQKMKAMKERKEKLQLERERKKKEKERQAALKKLEKNMEQAKQKKNDGSSSSEDEHGMILESDGDEADEDPNKCKACGLDEGEGQWIQCDLCDMWFHQRCTDLSALSITELETASYFCNFCLGK